MGIMTRTGGTTTRRVRAAAARVVDRRAAATLVTTALALVGLTPGGTASQGTTTAVAVSPGGRYVAFVTTANDLVTLRSGRPADRNAGADVYLRDTLTGTTRLVSATPTGTAGNGPATPGVSVSADGRYVAFASRATNLVAGVTDTNAAADVFVRDTVTRTTRVLSRTAAGALGDRASARYGQVALSADGSRLAFSSEATNLAAGDDNLRADTFLVDLVAGTAPVLVSAAPDGTPADNASGLFGVAISGDGRFVAYSSEARDLVPGVTLVAKQIYVTDTVTGTTELVSRASDGGATGGDGGNEDSGYYGLALSGDGRWVAFLSGASNLDPADTNGVADVFVADRATGTLALVTDAAGVPGDRRAVGRIGLSADGRHLAWSTFARDVAPGGAPALADVVVRDRTTGETVTLTAGADASTVSGASLSADGTVVGFVSPATTLLAADTNGLPDAYVATVSSVQGAD